MFHLAFTLFRTCPQLLHKTSMIVENVTNDLMIFTHKHPSARVEPRDDKKLVDSYSIRLTFMVATLPSKWNGKFCGCDM